MQEARIVMEPTARSPPNRDRLELKLILRILSVETITNAEIPKPRTGPITFPFNFIAFKRSFKILFFPLVRNHRTKAALTYWLITVAMAAPATPKSNTKMKMGSKTIFVTAPSIVVIIEKLLNPCALRNGFRPRVINTKTLPQQ